MANILRLKCLLRIDLFKAAALFYKKNPHFIHRHYEILGRFYEILGRFLHLVYVL